MMAGAHRDALPAAPTAVRSFVAVPLPSALRHQLLACAQRMTTALPGVKWCRKAENLHVTLKFLGQVALPTLEQLAEALSAAVARIPAFDGRLSGLGGFPSPEGASVIWAGVEASDEAPGAGFPRLAEVVEQTAAALGIPRERGRPFRAHVTVGRCKRAVDVRPAVALCGEWLSGRFRVDALEVYESRLAESQLAESQLAESQPAQSRRAAEGSTYVLRGRAALGGASA